MVRARWTFALGAVALGTLVALGAVELWARGAAPTRVQKFYSAEEYQLEIIDGVPTWKQNPQESALRWNLDCFRERPEAPRVAIMGSSILYGVRLEYEDSLGPQLSQHIQEDLGEEPCITNLSEAGFTFQTQWARAQAELPQIKPDVLIWEIWSNSPMEFRVLGEDAYNFGRLELDSLGFPNPLGLSPGINHTLLEYSGLWRYLVLGSTDETQVRSSTVWETFVNRELTMLIDWTEAEGIDLILVFCPSLNDDFDAVAERSEASYGYAERLGIERGLSMVYLAREFSGLDPVPLRLDPCCHFNSVGMAEVSERVAPLVGYRLASRSETVQ
jgi:hypothetical protein